MSWRRKMPRRTRMRVRRGLRWNRVKLKYGRCECRLCRRSAGQRGLVEATQLEEPASAGTRRSPTGTQVVSWRCWCLRPTAISASIACHPVFRVMPGTRLLVFIDLPLSFPRCPMVLGAISTLPTGEPWRRRRSDGDRVWLLTLDSAVPRPQLAAALLANGRQQHRQPSDARGDSVGPAQSCLWTDTFWTRWTMRRAGTSVEPPNDADSGAARWCFTQAMRRTACTCSSPDT